MKNKLLFGILFAVCNLCSLWFVGQYLLQRPRAALDISLPVHLSQTASATIGTACRNLHPEVDFLQRYCPFVDFKKCYYRWNERYLQIDNGSYVRIGLLFLFCNTFTPYANKFRIGRKHRFCYNKTKRCFLFT